MFSRLLENHKGEINDEKTNQRHRADRRSCGADGCGDDRVLGRWQCGKFFACLVRPIQHHFSGCSGEHARSALHPAGGIDAPQFAGNQFPSFQHKINRIVDKGGRRLLLPPSFVLGKPSVQIFHPSHKKRRFPGRTPGGFRRERRISPLFQGKRRDIADFCG